MKVLVFCEYYLPGFKAGGALRTIANMVDHIGEYCGFDIYCRDRDLGDSRPFNGIINNVWNSESNSRVKYWSGSFQYYISTLFSIKKYDYDYVYVNSLFSIYFSILPVLFYTIFYRLIYSNFNVIIAPRGELSYDALNIKPSRKKNYIYLLKLLRVDRRVVFQASSSVEYADIIKSFPLAKVIIAPDLPKLLSKKPRVERSSTIFKVVFLARITPIKNLELAVRILKLLSDRIGPIDFDVYGPVENKIYWDKCCGLLAENSKNINFTYKGCANPENVEFILSSYDMLALPSKSENYGHVIIESLSVGTPVLIGSNTPWSMVEELSMGWIWREDESAILNSIIEYAQISCVERDRYRYNVSLNLALLTDLKDSVNKNLSLFGVV